MASPDAGDQGKGERAVNGVTEPLIPKIQIIVLLFHITGHHRGFSGNDYPERQLKIRLKSSPFERSSRWIQGLHRLFGREGHFPFGDSAEKVCANITRWH
jgi:hypothetical protein